MTDREIAEHHTILRAVVGSNVHGLARNGQDDRDEMGVCLEPPECVIGLRRFEQWTHRTQPDGVRSGPGDLDVTIYSLRKWVRLALAGNPTVLILLYVPEASLVKASWYADELRALAPAFASKVAGQAFLGYLEAQRRRMTGEQGRKGTNRPELVAAYGYDTKYAMHALRLGLQGCEYLWTGRLTLPMSEHDRGMLMEVREGLVPLQEVAERIASIQEQLRQLLETSPLPPEPDRDRVEAFLLETYMTYWRTMGFVRG